MAPWERARLVSDAARFQIPIEVEFVKFKRLSVVELLGCSRIGCGKYSVLVIFFKFDENTITFYFFL